GGGVVIEPLEGRLPQRRQGIIDTLLARADKLHDPVELIRGTLLAAGDQGLLVEDIVARTALRTDVVPALLGSLQKSGEAVPVGRAGRWIHAPAFEQLSRRADEVVRKLHERDTAVDSLPLADVRAALGRMEPAVIEEALQHLVSKGRLVRTATGNVRHRDHSGELPDADRALCDAVQGALARGKGRPPELEDLEAELSLTTPKVQRALRLLEARRLAFKTETHWFDGAWVEHAKNLLRRRAAEAGGFTPAEARELLETTRKWVIPLLEALDKSGFCRRAGDRRVLRDS
ncbi:MAG: SelB C-terminal domain-containing protein, partial [Planctomycetota bacterium]|nr:SelB C-terminal domain-containing protein [Planctomycetota bacterium]